MTITTNASAAGDHRIVEKVGKAVKVASKTSSNTCSQVFGKLDPAQFQRRIEQRRRAIQHGKNTAGYDEYVKQVPKDQRRPRSMKHPSTPDYTLEIPTKRWQGLVKAWRKSLHQYDPPDLAKAFAEEATAQEVEHDVNTIKGMEIEEAHKQGLLVDLGLQHEESPTSVAFKCRSDHLLDQWESKADELDDAELDDSDDELL